MRASAWLLVEPLINLRNHLLGLQTKKIEISIGGQYQSRTFVDEIEPAIKLAIRRQVEEIEHKLRLLGVTID